MKQLLVILLLATLGWYGYGKYQARIEARDEAAARSQRARPAAAAAPAAKVQAGGRDPLFFTCDGRNQCNQMTSCEEAKFFLKNCPGLSTEENREGASCERQWCR